MEGLVFIILAVIASYVIRYIKSLQERGHAGGGSVPAGSRERQSSVTVKGAEPDNLRDVLQIIKDNILSDQVDHMEDSIEDSIVYESRSSHKDKGIDDYHSKDLPGEKPEVKPGLFIKNETEELPETGQAASRPAAKKARPKKEIPVSTKPEAVVDFKSPNGLARGFIYSEILGPPVSKRNMQPRRFR